jgi:multiple sugar transport system ATP-binding protein
VTHDQVEAMTLGDRIVVMNDGLIQQVAPPLVVYDYPANLFVAGFIGTPPMNFLKGSLMAKDGKTYFSSSGIKVKLPRDLASRVEAYMGKDVTFGVRPENVMVKGHTNLAEDENTMASQVSVVEPLGDEQIVYLQASGQDFIAKVDSHVGLKVGDSATMIIDVNRVHIFDNASGVNVSLRENATAVA